VVALQGLLLGAALGVLLARALPLLRHRVRRRPNVSLDREQLLAWIDAAPQGWLVLDPHDRIHHINPRGEKLLHLPGMSPARGQPLQMVAAHPVIEELVLSARRRGQPQQGEWVMREEPLEGHALPGRDGWLALLIQSRLSLEAQLQQQERWVGDVAHELKTPLTALTLVADRLEMAIRPQDARLVARLQRELDRLRLLVEDLLELSRLENTLPRESERYARVSVGSLVEGAWNSVRPLAEKRGVTLRLSGERGGSLLGDRPRLHRALLNLLDNAIRYTPDGETIDVEVLPSGNWWLLSVRDRGPGLSDHDIAHMFERFYRGDPARSRQTTSVGSGLGLAIVQQIALTHGGRVQARNHPRGGAVMELLLPRGWSQNASRS
jgi:two-component system phosphate regulon sensor histidine kinase PhoR